MKPAITLAQHLAHAADRWPEGMALSTAAGEWTFAGLLEQAQATAAGLAAGSPPPILALAADSRQLALAAYAGSAAGLTLWPLDPACAEQRWPAWQALAGRQARRLSELPAAGPAAPLAAAPADDLALVIATSGSEGEPKAVMLSHGNLDAAAAAANRCLSLRPGDLWLACLPLFHIGGLAILWRCARAGAGVLLHDGFAAEAVAASLKEQPVTHISLVPAMLARLLDLGAAPPTTLRVTLVGGAALSATLYQRATAAGWPVLPTWGMSETAAQVATRLPADGPWQEGDVGKPLPGNHVAVAPDGRLRVAGPQLMLGYLNPELRPGLGLADGWLTTGDLGRLDDRGHLTILGRADDMLVTGGSKVHPGEIENGLAACPGVRDVAVTALPDPTWGDLVVALVVGTADAAAVERWSREHLRPAARPRRILHLDDLPRHANGKMDRAALRRLAAGARP